MHKKIMIIGATSAIATEVARTYATRQAEFFLVGRHAAHLQDIAADLRIRGATQVEVLACDISDLQQHQAMIQQGLRCLCSIDIVLLAHGIMAKQMDEVGGVLEEIQTNFSSYVSLLTLLAPYFITQTYGCIAAISSVAGDRGRASNYTYGATKAGLNVFLQGLRHRLHAANVHVLTIKPGFVDTPMTRDYPKNWLWASPSRVALAIVTAIEKKQRIIYTPWFWRYIMLVIRFIPEKLFCRINFL